MEYKDTIKTSKWANIFTLVGLFNFSSYLICLAFAFLSSYQENMAFKILELIAKFFFLYSVFFSWIISLVILIYLIVVLCIKKEYRRYILSLVVNALAVFVNLIIIYILTLNS